MSERRRHRARTVRARRPARSTFICIVGNVTRLLATEHPIAADLREDVVLTIATHDAIASPTTLKADALELGQECRSSPTGAVVAELCSNVARRVLACEGQRPRECGRRARVHSDGHGIPYRRRARAASESESRSKKS
jgi:hypothetical protein